MAKHIPIFLSVNPHDQSQDEGRVVFNHLGNNCRVFLNEKLELPRGAVNSQIALKSFTSYYSFPNITSDEVMTIVDGGDTYVIEFVTGLYDTKSFQRQVENQLAEKYPGNGVQFEFQPNYSTETLELVHNVNGSMTLTPLLQKITGFGANTPLVSGTRASGEDLAMFNQVNNLLLKCSLLNSNGIQVSNSSARNRQILDLVNINVKPSRQIIHQPNELMWYDCNLDNGCDEIEISILNEKEQDIIVNNSYTFNLVLRYEMEA